MARFGGDNVGGKLVEYEPIEGDVTVEGPNHVVTIGIGIRANAVVAEHEDPILGVCVTSNVEPVPAPALAIVWRGEQAIDNPGKGIVGTVALEGLDLLGGRRQPDQVVIGSPQERAPVGRRGRCQAASFQPGKHETIDRHSRPALALDRGWVVPADRLIRPVLASRREVNTARFGAGLRPEVPTAPLPPP